MDSSFQISMIQPKSILGVEKVTSFISFEMMLIFLNETLSSMICGIIEEVSLAKANGIKFEPNLKGRNKTGRKSITDMDSQ